MTLLLIGLTLFAKRDGGSWVEHPNYVLDFAIIDRKIYIVERIKGTPPWDMNVYTGYLKFDKNISVDGITFVDEPLKAYINDLNYDIDSIERNGKTIFIDFE